MDEIDRKILAELQHNGRISVSDLAQKIGLSDSPCHRRLKALEKAGIITGYRAEINAAAVGLGFSAIVFVTLKECTAQLVEGFEEAVQRVPQITDCRRLFNTPDYIVTVVTRSITEYQELYDDTLSRLPGVLRLNSTIVMQDVIPGRGLPL